MNLGLKEKLKRDFLESLNPEQRKAVEHFEGPLLVFAGAGSGKTKVITHRIAYLVRINDVNPSHILAVTFTNKAAEEMRNRVQLLMGPYSEKITIKTFHSLGLQIIRENYKLLNLDANFSVYDTSSQKNLAKKILKEFKVREDMISPSEILYKIHYARDEFLEPEDLSNKYPDYPYLDLFYDFYKSYIAELRKNNAVDFSDLLFESVKILKNHPDILKNYQERWKFLMIDEYQDTNYVQYLLSKLISGKYKNIVVVGDDDQTIYSWRGARIENILSFHKDFGYTKIIKLEENYRSTNEILKLANRVISKNKNRNPKKLFSKISSKEKPELYELLTEYEEAEFVVKKIKENSPPIPLREIAIFYRINAQSRIFEEVLRKHQIPYVIYGGFKFYERKEIKDILSYLQFINNPKDFDAFERMIENPPKGIGEKTLQQIKEFADKNKIHYLNAIQSLIESNALKNQKIKEFYNKLIKWFELSKKSLSELLDSIVKDSQMISYYERNLDPESVSRIENIKEFLKSISEYEERKKLQGEEVSLSHYLQEISLLTNEDILEEQKNSVNLMTLHNAKGLEFTLVFITGLEDGILPHQFSIEEEKLEEERRLFYVGITRAKKKLYLTYCMQRKRYGSYENSKPSRFIEDLKSDSEYLLKKNMISRSLNHSKKVKNLYKSWFYKS
ncbi:MAG: ATP-dependent helicase [Leptonema sp. (in: bacteria)]